jgi:NADPH2:quinone reductase
VQDVLIRVKAFGVNPVETYIRSGAYAGFATYPYTPGNDAAGVIEAVGSAPAAQAFRAGMPVYTMRTKTGAYAELTVAEAKYVRPLPVYRIPSVSLAAAGTTAAVASDDLAASVDQAAFRVGASLGTPYYTAYRALFQKMKIRPGRTLFVHGATGAVGIAACQIATAFGMRVIGSSGSTLGDETVRQWCDAVVRHGRGADTVQDILKHTPGGNGADYILEMLANVNLNVDLGQLVAKDGCICIVGSRGDANITPRDIMRKECTVTGVLMFAATPADLEESGAYIDSGVRSGTLRPCVDTALEGLESSPQAHTQVIEHAGGASGKIVVDVP